MDVNDEDVRDAETVGDLKDSSVPGCVEQGQVLEAVRSSSSDT